MMLNKLRSFFFGTLRRQLIVSVVMVHAVMMSLIIWDLNVRQHELLLDQQTSMATALSKSIATSSSGWLASRDLTGLQELVDAQSRYDGLNFAMILDQQGVVLAHTDRQRLGKYVLDMPDHLELRVLEHKEMLVDVINPVIVAGQHVGWVRVGLGQGKTHDQLNHLTQAGVLYALAAILIGGISAALMARYLTRRLDNIQSVADAVQEGVSSRRASIDGSDEAAQLARQFNLMLDTLAEREQELTASRDAMQLTQFALDHSQEGAFWLDVDGGIVNVNEYACNSLGYAHDELLKMHIWDFDPDFSSTAWPVFFSQLSRDKFIAIETRHRHRNGTIAEVEITASHVIFGDKEYSFALVRDVSGRKKMEQALIESESKFRRVFEDVADPSLLLKNGRFFDCNMATLELLGYPNKQDFLNVSPADISPPDQPDGSRSDEKAAEMIAITLRCGTHRFEWMHLRHDGTNIPVEVTATLITVDGELVLHVNWRDITERKNAELRERMRNQILEQVNRGAPLKDILEAIVLSFEHERADAVCSILLLDTAEQNLIAGAAPNLPEFYNRAIDNLRIGDGVGSCGTAAFRGELVIAEDLQQHPYWSAYRDLTRRAELHSCWSHPVKDAQGKVLGTFAIYHHHPSQPMEGDLILIAQYANLAQIAIESHRSQRELRIAATAFESQGGMMVTDPLQRILRVNRAFTDITGYEAEDIIGKSPVILSSGRQDADFYAKMWTSINDTGAWEGEIWNRHKNGEIYPQHLGISVVHDSNGEISNYVATLTDISQRKQAGEEIKHLAIFDPLTGLPNRRLLLDRLQQALASSVRSGQSFALLFVDLDKFKTLNDTLGHDIGDMLLQQVAERLTSCVREGDTVARLSGDEFVVILEELNKNPFEAASKAELVGEKILARLTLPYQLATHQYRCSSSIGVTLFKDRASGVDELLVQADIAMYQAKKGGRNALRFFDPKMQESINLRADLEEDLRKAIENNQFHLHYQIQVDDMRKPSGAEVLIRWQHPQRGMVSPAQFIPLAEETGLILPIGEWVLEHACAQLNIWQQEVSTSKLVLAVNVSAKQFRQAGFAEQVQATVMRHGINPTRLKLELTESMLLDNIEETITTMHVLRKFGVQFSLDDFGTGYSSLQYLKRLPLDQIKIDQSFVRDLVSDDSSAAIVSTIIVMAQSLGLEVIAEGVETKEQQKLLLAKGCRHYQGYFFGRPMPIANFEQQLQQT